MLEKELKSILKDQFGHEQFRLNQLEIITSILEGNDTLAIMPTGGGKSICYQIPALYSDGICLVVSPLISLMHDQVTNLEVNGVKACYLNSSQSFDERKEAEALILNEEVKLVYVSPEGLLSGYLSHFFDQVDIALIAIDEAHCVSQWGHEFRKDYTRLGELKDLFPKVPLLALTATADSRTRKDIKKQLRMDDPEVFLSSFDRPNIQYSICERENEIKQLNDFIEKNHPDDTGIVYCLSRKKVEKTAQELNRLGYKAYAYHAGMSSDKREKVQKIFNTKNRIIIVATIAFGMGIDRPDVRFVAHLDLPKSIEGYYQETGRAGRDGLPSSAWMVYGLQDVIKLSQMLETTDATEAYKKVAKFKLDSMLSLCETSYCRRKFLLGYFEEELPEDCGNCDACLEPAETWDGTVDAQKILSVIYKTGEIFGSSYLIDVIRGSKNAKVIERSHDQLSVYAIGSDKSKSHWNSIIRQLLNQNYIGIRNWDYRNLYLLEKSREILKGEVTFMLRKSKESVRDTKRSKKQLSADHGRDNLFEELRQIRSHLAEEHQIPPYIVFSDKTLHDMCHLLPQNEDEFLMVNGVGKSKCEKYASVFLGKIQEHL
ncbi:MAG: DNA helicase RecQ [Bacteriovoracaceae bacterium]